MPNPVMEQFISEVDAIVKTGGTEEAITAQVAEKLAPVLRESELLPDQFMQPKETGNALYPIYIAPDESFCVTSAVWGIGKITGIHDHGTWGVIGIYSGSECEESFRREEIPTDQPAELEKKGTRLTTAGDVFVCCTSDKDIHRVSSSGDQVSVGIHVYGGNISKIERHTFDADTGVASALITPWDVETPLYS